jgi:hypothetical protein
MYEEKKKEFDDKETIIDLLHAIHPIGEMENEEGEALFGLFD